MPTHNNARDRQHHLDLLQRASRTRHPTRVRIGPKICRTCHLQRTPQERRSDDLLVGECHECHDPSL
ncbi:MAG: hypothetical protein LC799_35005 [Actinobacteria bacterium]|nr:hypothetical protein [Actinomycetota bacterium]